ncbi:DUF6152 family protein [Marinobacter sp.]|uniref:DUF6152 family protein n=1 Tax=Marinobacter sp. TaxID=50741 RepID=UPI00384C37E2
MRNPGNRAVLAVMVLSGLLLATFAVSHHGWGWLNEDEFSITGEVVFVRLGNPHGEITIDADGVQWIVELGQPWRNREAGLTMAHLPEGKVITAQGHRSRAEGHHRMMAERLIIDGRNFDLFPDRL